MPKLFKNMVASQKNHLFAVLREQARQNELGEENPDAIARTSFQCSKSAARRARKIGIFQSSNNVDGVVAQEVSQRWNIRYID